MTFSRSAYNSTKTFLDPPAYHSDVNRAHTHTRPCVSSARFLQQGPSGASRSVHWNTRCVVYSACLSRRNCLDKSERSVLIPVCRLESAAAEIVRFVKINKSSSSLLGFLKEVLLFLAEGLVSPGKTVGFLYTAMCRQTDFLAQTVNYITWIFTITSRQVHMVTSGRTLTDWSSTITDSNRQRKDSGERHVLALCMCIVLCLSVCNSDASCLMRTIARYHLLNQKDIPNCLKLHNTTRGADCFFAAVLPVGDYVVTEQLLYINTTIRRRAHH